MKLKELLARLDTIKNMAEEKPIKELCYALEQYLADEDDTEVKGFNNDKKKA
jgi:hypothetical protein